LETLVVWLETLVIGRHLVHGRVTLVVVVVVRILRGWWWWSLVVEEGLIVETWIIVLV
jgi:hypothetical protein